MKKEVATAAVGYVILPPGVRSTYVHTGMEVSVIGIDPKRSNRVLVNVPGVKEPVSLDSSHVSPERRQSVRVDPVATSQSNLRS
jgi:hypothetical protein